MIFNALFGLLDWLIGLLPQWDLTAPIDAAVDTALGFAVVSNGVRILKWFDYYAPVTEALLLLSIWASVYGALYVYRLVLWVYARIPGKAT